MTIRVVLDRGVAARAQAWDELSQTCVSECSGNACDLVYDGNEDGIVGSGDLLGLLTEFDVSAHLKQFSLAAIPSITKVMITRRCKSESNVGLLKT